MAFQPGNKLGRNAKDKSDDKASAKEKGPLVFTSAKQLERLKERGRYRDDGPGAVKGLYLQVTNPANRSFVLRYQLGGVARNMGLGPYPEVSLSKAREYALEIRERIRREQIDPIEQRKAQKRDAAERRAKVQTFRQAAERYFQKAAPEWSTDAQRKAFQSTMERFAFPIIGDMDVAHVDTPAVLRVLEPIWKEKPTVASLLRIRLEAILATATVGGFRSGDNPARWKGHLSEMLPTISKIHEVKHHPALPYAELPAFMTELRAKGDMAAKAMEFLILTVLRAQAVLKARWEEIDFESRLWTVPAARCKRKKGSKAAKLDHVVPLSDAAMALLRSMEVMREPGNPFIFPGRRKSKTLKSDYLDERIEAMGRKGVATSHGFRATFKIWAHEDRRKFEHDVIEMALGHVIGDATEQAYRRNSTAIEKRRDLRQAWADYCDGVQPGDSQAQGDTVVPFRARG